MIPLKKQKLLNILISGKNDNLNIKDKKKKFSFGGKLLKVFWKTKYTKFDVSEYVKVSKKQRTNISEKKIKDVLQYSFLGYCFDYKKDFDDLNCSFSLRNVLDGFPVEMIFPLHSPAILTVSFCYDLYNKKSTRSKFFFLRKKPNPDSTMEFDYVLRKKEEIIIRKNSTIRKLRK